MEQSHLGSKKSPCSWFQRYFCFVIFYPTWGESLMIQFDFSGHIFQQLQWSIESMVQIPGRSVWHWPGIRYSPWWHRPCWWPSFSPSQRRSVAKSGGPTETTVEGRERGPIGLVFGGFWKGVFFRWWQLKDFLFSPVIWGRFPLWLIFFQRGWNHQLVFLFDWRRWFFAFGDGWCV